MWLFTELGFFSIVKKAPGEWHLRARVRADLDNIAALSLPGDPQVVESYAGSDYPWRMILDKRSKSALFVRLSKIEYGNFKGRVAEIPDQREKLAVYHDVWAKMRILEMRNRRRADVTVDEVGYYWKNGDLAQTLDAVGIPNTAAVGKAASTRRG